MEQLQSMEKTTRKLYKCRHCGMMQNHSGKAIFCRYCGHAGTLDLQYFLVNKVPSVVVRRCRVWPNVSSLICLLFMLSLPSSVLASWSDSEMVGSSLHNSGFAMWAGGSGDYVCDAHLSGQPVYFGGTCSGWVFTQAGGSYSVLISDDVSHGLYVGVLPWPGYFLFRTSVSWGGSLTGDRTDGQNGSGTVNPSVADFSWSSEPVGWSSPPPSPVYTNNISVITNIDLFGVSVPVETNNYYLIMSGGFLFGIMFFFFSVGVGTMWRGFKTGAGMSD